MKLTATQQHLANIMSATTGELADIVTLTTKSHERFRTQTGQYVWRSTGWHARYYVDNPNPYIRGRVKICIPLEVPSTADESQVKLALKKHMKKVNAEQRGAWAVPTSDQILVSVYWEAMYLPMIEANRSWSTARTYKKLWDLYCKDYFKNKILTRYATVDGNRFLTELAQRKLRQRGKKSDEQANGLNRSSLSLVRTICTGLFSYAQNEGLIDRNPFSDVRISVKVRKPQKKVMYSLAEVAAVLSEIPRTDAKLLFAFCSLLGLRPSEAAAIQWSDVNGNLLSILRAAPAGHLGETKTENSVGSVLIIKPVARLIEQWRKECGRADGFMFKRRNGHVINASDFTAMHIVEHARKAIGSRWHGLYAGRRAVGKALYNLTGDIRATAQNLRNDQATSLAHYSEPSVESGRAGSVLLEQAFEIEEAKLLKA
jgi:integrase